MFILRSLFWLSTIVMLLPASPDGSEPAPRVSLLHTAYAVRVLMQDVTGVCERNPEACAASREALVLFDAEARDRRRHRSRRASRPDRSSSRRSERRSRHADRGGSRASLVGRRSQAAISTELGPIACDRATDCIDPA